jgi:myo-inositol 2-dehydrogenase/D-chiro-inositol 1-dehydrogenase
MSPAPLRIGLAGFGIHGRRYARHLLQGDVPGACLAAVSRRSREAGLDFAREHGLGYFDDLRELAAHDGIDAVVLVLPPHLHAPTAIACLSHGKPVLVEKPLAADSASARKVTREVERTGGCLMVAHTLRFDPIVVRLREEAAQLGALRLVAINQRFEPTTRPWIDEPGPGGILLNTGVHGFDLLRYLTGLEPVSILANCARGVARRTDDCFAGTLRLEPGGVLATIDNVRATRSRSGRIEVVAEYGQVWGDHVHRTLAIVRGRERTDLGPVPPAPTVVAALTAFVDCVRRATAPPVSAADGLAAVELADAAARSAREGRRVELEEIRRGHADDPA